MQQLRVLVREVGYLARIGFKVVQLPLLGSFRLWDEDGFPVSPADGAATEELPTLDELFLVDPVGGALLTLAIHS